MKLARAVRDVIHEDWRENNGRKSKADIVHQWQKENPTGRKVDCIRETGVGKTTVYKHWL